MERCQATQVWNKPNSLLRRTEYSCSHKFTHPLHNLQNVNRFNISVIIKIVFVYYFDSSFVKIINI